METPSARQPVPRDAAVPASVPAQEPSSLDEDMPRWLAAFDACFQPLGGVELHAVPGHAEVPFAFWWELDEAWIADATTKGAVTP